MLAQSFKSAAELKLTTEQRDALCRVLVLLETGKMHHVIDAGHIWFHNNDEPLPFTGGFNMIIWSEKHDCGTVACIGGTAEILAGRPIFQGAENPQLSALFKPGTHHHQPCVDSLPSQPRARDIDWNKITTEQAATALRNYLTTGYADWESVL